MIEKILADVHLVVAAILVVRSLIIISYSMYGVYSSIKFDDTFIPAMVQEVGAVIISAAILDVADYMIEEEVALGIKSMSNR